MPKKVLVLLADGFEEVEAVTPIDYLYRAGIEVTMATITDNHKARGAHFNLNLKADTLLDNVLNPESKLGSAKSEYLAFDAVIVPGGMPGAENLANSKEVGLLLKEMADAGKLICAICASPAYVLSPLGLLDGKKFTCYPGAEKKVEKGIWQEDRVVVDGNIITSRGAGTAGEWAIEIIRALLGEETAKKIAQSVLL